VAVQFLAGRSTAQYYGLRVATHWDVPFESFNQGVVGSNPTRPTYSSFHSHAASFLARREVVGRSQMTILS